MKACPRCATVALGPSMKCRKCRALLVAPPAPPAPAIPAAVPAQVGAGPAPAAPAPTVEEQFFAPATLTPVVVAPPLERRAEKRRGPRVAILVLAVILGCAALAYATVGSGSSDASRSAGAAKTPVTLPPIGASGLPNLADAVRVQAEASRQHAFVVVAQASAEMDGAALDARMLANLDPTLEWVTAAESSTGPRVVSFSQSGDTVVVAVATKSGDVCAFGRWSPATVGEYVTVGNVSSCRAADAPATGWTQLDEVGGGSSAESPEGY
jgi:hypothetical protein